MKTMRKGNDEIYQLTKDQALVKKLKNKKFRPFCLWPPDIMFVTRESKNSLFFVLVYIYIYIYIYILMRVNKKYVYFNVYFIVPCDIGHLNIKRLHIN